MYAFCCDIFFGFSKFNTASVFSQNNNDEFLTIVPNFIRSTREPIIVKKKVIKMV